MSRDQRITVYVSEQERNRIEREADAKHMGLSSYIMSAVEDKWNEKDIEESAERTQVEERVEQIASQATDDMAAMIEQQQKRTEQMTDMVARSAIYSIANFESLKYQHKLPEEVKTKSLKLGARRLGDPLDLNADQNAALADGDLPDELASAADDTEDDSAGESESKEDSPGIKEGFFDRYA